MTLRKLASLIAKREGKKTQARIGEVREVIAIIGDLIFESEFDNSIALYNLLYDAGEKRAKKKKKS